MTGDLYLSSEGSTVCKGEGLLHWRVNCLLVFVTLSIIQRESRLARDGAYADTVFFIGFLFSFPFFKKKKINLILFSVVDLS